MTDRLHEAYHAGPAIGMAAGAAVSVLLFQGPLHMRLAAGLVGAAFSFVGTPIFSPLVAAGFGWLYGQAGVDSASIPADAIPGVTGFVLGITGIDACRFMVDRTKGVLSMLYLPIKGREQ